MKYTLHVPVEQFGFVVVEMEDEKHIPSETIAEAYREVAEAFKPQPINAVPAVEFDEMAEEYLQTGKLANGGDHEFSPDQQKILKLITRIIRKRNQ